MNPSPIPQWLQRYRLLVKDWTGFLEALLSPLPTCLWTNPLRLEPAALESILVGEGLCPRALPYQTGAFLLAPGVTVGHRWWYRAGLCHSQEEASLLPVRLLAPQPGERVLDLCAAPGGKSAQISIALGNTGTLVANDVSISRMRPLRANIERLGLINVTTTRCDGTGYPIAAGPFDRVLVDAPCSCEGTLRKNPGLARAISTDARARLVRLQYALLCRAVQLCRPGGRIVYATCTFAPEENEGIIDRLLADHAQVVELESPQLPGVAASPGITAWRDRVFDPRLRRARRIWPHRQDSGGFFLASLRKLGTVQPSGLVSSPLPVLEVPELDRIVLERHAIAREAFHHWIAIRRSARGIQFVNKDHRPPSHPDAEASGLLLLRHRASPPKLSTCGAMLLGGQARRNVVDLTRGQMQAYFARADARLSPAQQARCGGSGNIIVRFRGFALGVAYYDDRLGLLHSRYPKRWAGIKGDLAE